ncbi:MAG: hypothetical protein IPL96_08060 [Holophagaceae bacterium]|nr:hypothetical protein [Holophagaceae bacterium]
MSIAESAAVGSMQPRPKLPLANRLLRFIAITIILFLAVASSCVVASRTIDRDMRQPITDAIPNGFPVLVFWYQNGSTSLHAKVIPLEELDAHRKDHPNTFFLLPEGRGQELHNCLRQQAEGIDADIHKQYNTGRVMQVTARLESSDQSHQSWRVRFQHGNEHVNIGYYTASSNAIKPTYIERYFGPSIALQSLPLDIASWALVWSVAAISIYLLSRIRYFNASKWVTHAT